MKYFKECKNYSQQGDYIIIKIKSYKFLGLNMLFIGKNNLALQFFTKMLRLAWFVKSSHYEI